MYCFALGSLETYAVTSHPDNVYTRRNMSNPEGLPYERNNISLT